jgi:hypothetical protein
MRRTFSKEKRIWTNVRLEEVMTIIMLLLAGIIVSVVELLLERVTASRTLMQQQRPPRSPGLRPSNVSPQQAEDNCDLPDMEHPVSSQVV